ncbi:MAG: DNA polymerase III subunit chi [Rhizobiales bacterium]|nr:DNA polymerase III subunit chi [Hyphomicrobiales bacterium]MBO6698468.1 DNA polymerase III subunit chi [Hyphomicrobiales bacterium]MBO6735278.1 DNA polymerase III subunit chi [Hyphomicrobiales bacterium]MBO6910914.1 DNA polymerase III subunit chi [Hyphomicrobiales bacterium]MBO6957284.1 DNA polymerase III subunit chi [Hyphomicrobiales bacterium]
MADVAFYHLQTVSLETALPQLLAKCLERDWRVVVEVGEPSRLKDLDDHLWTYNEASFLPHAGEGATDPQRHPIWLSATSDNPNGAAVRFFVEGALPSADHDLSAYQRAILMFDGTKPDSVQAARGVWKRLHDDDHTLSYWRQSETGAWQRADQ